MERILINGEWYVKETSTNIEEIDDTILDFTHTESLIYEDKKYCFEVIRIYRDDEETFYDSLDVEFTDKRPSLRTEWKTEYWDNPKFIIGIYENDEDCIKDALQSMDQDGLITLKKIVKQLIEKEWLTI